ncbi:translation initiation factor IF-3 [Candidatus Poribacteria bacterium]|nr:translation initiation factor IF-3 [Candidatus Poribacteria bacterium]MYA71368.1 translation initiation factor IF-3 [Candidatus Poribacteria bacterium]MYH82040.1 translation initiation factor IF-3 [Candidatus Poribacteria bacterium]MYK95221.1 translation initiation factor IF-3 [Candidatus Poribacteria bacterium]
MHYRGRRNQRTKERQSRSNYQIRAKEILVIDHENKQLGVMSPRDALQRAEEVGLDLVEVSPNANPPVCKIMDYGKYQYEKNKRAREARKKQTKVVLKGMQFRPDTAEHDYQFKKRHVEDFLKNGWKVRATVRFRGREMLHTELGNNLLSRLKDDLEEIADVEQPPRMETRMMSMILTPKSV